MFSRLFSVERGMPVLSASSLWVIPASPKRLNTVADIERECCSDMSIRSTVVPIWNRIKPRSARVAKKIFLDRYLQGHIWVYLLYMATGAREPSDYSLMVAAQIRAERAAAKLTGAEMMHKSGISRSTYLRIESGTHVADTTQLARICGALGLTLSEFFHRVEARLINGNNGKS